MKLYTIGFTQKTAEEFFGLLEKNGIKKLVDTRINNVSQLAGFAKGNDLKYFVRRILQINYEHRKTFAPTKELLAEYRKGSMTWTEYEKEYLTLLNDRQILNGLDISHLEDACLLCSEHEPHHCHRRLLAEYLKEKFPSIEIIHLQ